MICCTYLIECDGGCGATVTSDLSAKDLDIKAAADGWRLGPSIDHCPKCAPPISSRPDPTDAAAGVWALVERAQAGDAEAFGRIYDRYLDTVFRFIYFRVGNRQLAEDLTADTFLRALKRIGSFTWQGRDPGAWLVTIARNLVADHFKSGRYRLEVTTGDVLDADRADDRGGPETVTVDYLTNVALMRAVQLLTTEQRKVIILRFLRGLNVAETAEELGVNIGAVKAMQYRATRRLGQLAPELGDGHAPKPSLYLAPRQRQRKQRVTCDNCRQPLNGLLAECHREACLTAVNDLETSTL